jgi:hypothetical protein
MRNPSPYNLFTDLSPGLFTHVGLVAVEQGSDGIRRFVIVDLPERGTSIPATPVDAYLQRTLHFFFLRHEDAEVCRGLGQAAGELIGNESQFDLNFRTSRIRELQGRPLRGAAIHTYCAGLLLIAAQQTGRPREEFFPIVEAAAGGHTPANLQRIGLSLGDDFVSPTGAMFSPRLNIVGQREPMYDPGREVQEAVFDHFASCLRERELSPSPDAFQALRQSVAALAKDRPWLARALARASHVSEHLDLEAAARAATVVENLDEIAEGNLKAFVEARQAVLAGPLDDPTRQQLAPEELRQLETYQQQHADLCRAWGEGRVNSRQVRLQLVRYYVDRGRRQLEERFFPPAAKPSGN